MDLGGLYALNRPVTDDWAAVGDIEVLDIGTGYNGKEDAAILPAPEICPGEIHAPVSEFLLSPGTGDVGVPDWLMLVQCSGAADRGDETKAPAIVATLEGILGADLVIKASELLEGIAE